jgi:hypothetical protein
MFSEELNIVQSMWDDLGVTDGYKMLFESIARELEENLRKEFIDFEIGSLKRFSDNLMVISINSRNLAKKFKIGKKRFKSFSNSTRLYLKKVLMKIIYQTLHNV